VKPGIHPEYRPVIFKDAAAGFAILTRSTMKSDRTERWDDGQEYPVVSIEISSASHPFWSGTQRLIDSAGRIQKFRARYAGLSMSPTHSQDGAA
jgi:large subunit ribosomal protein L31